MVRPGGYIAYIGAGMVVQTSLVSDHGAHRTMPGPSLDGPMAVSSLGTGMVTVRVSQPTSSPHLAKAHAHAEVAELKKQIFPLSKSVFQAYRIAKCVFPVRLPGYN